MAYTHFQIEPNTPRTTLPLNGLWEITGNNETEVPNRFSSKVQVPAVVDMASPPYDWQHCLYHWYRKTFVLDHLQHTSAVYLKINQSMFGTEVWLNGHHLGGSISCYTSHEYPLHELLHTDQPNELIIRVGAKSTLPPESAVGRDQEKEIYTPGIWGNVSLVCTGGARVSRVQVIPHIDSSTAEIRAWINNCKFIRESLLVSVRIFEKNTGTIVSPIHDTIVRIEEHDTARVSFQLLIDAMHLWSPDQPFLYEAEISVFEGQTQHDSLRTTFGMREFSIAGSDFYLNGKKILLRGGNIAFHRFLSDPQRQLLPWNHKWIKKAFIDIPKEHHFNFFRNHLGQMYNAWYDIADEHGMLIQNEWHFWGVTGSDQQIRKEFTEWLQDNWNHPSIIIWDPLNESSDDTIKHEIVPEMKRLDPTRPWESVDFLEEHPYIYSLGMVLNNRTLGFTASLEEIERRPVPSMVNEFLWWWFNDKWEPTVLTKMIATRWLGREYTTEEVIKHQSFLAQELIELFRRMRVKAIQPFVYISNNDGPTAHWFLGDIKDLHPKPLLKAIKNSFSPFGVSVELWDRHFYEKERRLVRFMIFNDSSAVRTGSVRFGLKTSDDQWLLKKDIPVQLDTVSDLSIVEEVYFPSRLDDWSVVAELSEHEHVIAQSVKQVYVFETPKPPDVRRDVNILDPSHEIIKFLGKSGIGISDFHDGNFNDASVMILHGNVLGNREYLKRRDEVKEFLSRGGHLVLIEPEFRVVGSAVQTIVDGVELTVWHRPDLDKGGYDSYVYAEDHSHPLWNKIEKKHLKMFNGGYGGEIVSQYDVGISTASKRLASCGMDLNVAAAFEASFRKGKIIVFRLQLRGRLINDAEHTGLYSRRADPVAQQLLFNILKYCDATKDGA